MVYKKADKGDASRASQTDMSVEKLKLATSKRLFKPLISPLLLDSQHFFSFCQRSTYFPSPAPFATIPL